MNAVGIDVSQGKSMVCVMRPFSVHLIVICVTSVYFQSAKFRTFQPVNMYQEAPAACRCLLAEKIRFRTSSAAHLSCTCRCRWCRWDKRTAASPGAWRGYPG